MSANASARALVPWRPPRASPSTTRRIPPVVIVGGAGLATLAVLMLLAPFLRSGGQIAEAPAKTTPPVVAAPAATPLPVQAPAPRSGAEAAQAAQPPPISVPLLIPLPGTASSAHARTFTGIRGAEGMRHVMPSMGHGFAQRFAPFQRAFAPMMRTPFPMRGGFGGLFSGRMGGSFGRGFGSFHFFRH